MYLQRPTTVTPVTRPAGQLPLACGTLGWLLACVLEFDVRSFGFSLEPCGIPVRVELRERAGGYDEAGRISLKTFAGGRKIWMSASDD